MEVLEESENKLEEFHKKLLLEFLGCPREHPRRNHRVKEKRINLSGEL